MSSHEKLLLLGAAFNTSNMGVSVLAAGALKVLWSRFPDAEIALLDYGVNEGAANARREGIDVSIPLINLRFSWKILLPNNVALLLLVALLLKVCNQRVRTAIIGRNERLRAICAADYAFAVSGGDSFSDIYGFERFAYVALPQLLVILLGKKLILLPQTIGPFGNAISSAIARFILRRAQMVFSREAVSEATNALIGKGVTPMEVRVCYDMGFCVDARAPRDWSQQVEEQRDRPLVGVNVSGLLVRGGYSGTNAFGLSVDYVECVRRVIEFLIEERSAAVLLIPHVYGDAGESDTCVTEELFEALKSRHGKRLAVVTQRFDHSELKYVIGSCDFFVGSRMHACIGALSQAVPAVGLAYSKKFAGVFDSVGVGDLVCDLRSLSIDETIAKIDAAFARRREISEHLRETMPVVNEVILGALEGVR